MSARVLPAGDRALLVEVADSADVMALTNAARSLLGVEDVVPGHRTVLISWPIGTTPPQVDWDSLLECAPSEELRAAPVTVAVRYGGPDLADVARIARISPEEAVVRHCAATYTVGFMGFAPGFAYLLGGDPMLAVPRREQPRPSVPAGSVAVAGPYSTVYPRSSPGGWQLIGTTAAAIFDPGRDSPALFQPGAAVRFRSVTE